MQTHAVGPFAILAMQTRLKACDVQTALQASCACGAAGSLRARLRLLWRQHRAARGRLQGGRQLDAFAGSADIAPSGQHLCADLI